ncbi:MAG: hypothetical protein HQL72_07255, partial [Magnetococcales bacterium]|nr:hypothetical protein [Magnetococcales bacterium]
LEGVDLSGTGEGHEISIQAEGSGGNQVIVDKISINGEEIQAEDGASWDKGDANEMQGGVHIHKGDEITFEVQGSEEAAEEAGDEAVAEEEVVDQTLTGDEDSNVLVGGDGDDTLTGGAGDDVMGGEAGDDTMMGGDGNDLFIFGADSGMDTADGGGGGWIDTVDLQGVDGGPSDSLEEAGDWTLETDAEYTIDAENNTIDFTDGDASGTITLEDGSVLEFENMDDITW